MLNCGILFWFCFKVVVKVCFGWLERVRLVFIVVLRAKISGKIIAAIRRDYNPTWPDRRVQGFNGSYGENRLATRPAILIELAFMDRPTPDNAALHGRAWPASP